MTPASGGVLGVAESDNPAAFPSVCLGDPGHPASVPGMSLRDWFAGQALSGLLAHPQCGPIGGRSEQYRQRTAIVAEEAYAAADAMLALRSAATAARTGEKA